MSPRRSLTCLALTVLALSGCGERERIESRLKAIRTYGWPASVIDPEPDWNPARQVLVARSMGGFSILEEGGPGEHKFAADDRREASHPCWLNANQFVYGPAWNARRNPDGTVTTPSDGLTVVTIADDRPTAKTSLSDRGFMPKLAGGAQVAAQDGNRIIFVDTRGRITEFGEGFDAEPQPDGPGLCWRDTPAFAPDWWTGRPGPGNMHVRWTPGRVDDLGNAVQAAWARDGSVLATVLAAPAKPGQPWWSGGTSIVRMAGAGSPITPIRPGARDPAPHPAADLMAWTSEDGEVWMGTINPGPNAWSDRVTDSGFRPRWSKDGLRLTWLQPPAPGSQLPSIRVAVLVVR